jgi:hypothetical protein
MRFAISLSSLSSVLTEVVRVLRWAAGACACYGHALRQRFRCLGHRQQQGRRLRSAVAPWRHHLPVRSLPPPLSPPGGACSTPSTVAYCVVKFHCLVLVSVRPSLADGSVMMMRLEIGFSIFSSFCLPLGLAAVRGSAGEPHKETD